MEWWRLPVSQLTGTIVGACIVLVMGWLYFSHLDGRRDWKPTITRIKIVLRSTCLLFGTGASVYINGWGFWNCVGGFFGGLIVYLLLAGWHDAIGARTFFQNLNRDEDDDATVHENETEVSTLLRERLNQSFRETITRSTPLEQRGILDRTQPPDQDGSGTVIKVMRRAPLPEPDEEECDAFIDVSDEDVTVYLRSEGQDGWSSPMTVERDQVLITDGDVAISIRANVTPALNHIIRDLVAVAARSEPPNETNIPEETLRRLRSIPIEQAEDLCTSCGVDPEFLRDSQSTIMGGRGTRSIDLG